MLGKEGRPGHQIDTSSPPQPSPRQKEWDNCKADMTSTYKLTRTIAISSTQKLGNWLTNSHPTGWVFSKTQDRVLKQPIQG